MKKFVSLFLIFASFAAYSYDVPHSFTYLGRIMDPSGLSPLVASSVEFKLQIRSANGTCLLYEETHVRNMLNSDGVFALNIGLGTNTNASSLDLAEVFDNSKTLAGRSCSYTPASGDGRKLRLVYHDGSQIVTVPQDQNIRSVPYALNSQTLQGLEKDKFFQTSTVGTQLKLNELMNRYSALVGLADGTNTNYVTTADLPISGGVIDLSSGGLKLPNTPASTDSAVNKFYTDSKVAGRGVDLTGMVNGQTLVWNSTLNTWKPTSLAGSLSTGTISGSTAIDTSGDLATSGRVILKDTVSGKKVTVSAPANLSQDYQFIFPVNKGSANQVLMTDGNGNLSWTSSAGGSSADATISSKGVVQLADDGLSTLGTVVQATDLRLSNARTPSGSASGDLSATYPSPKVAKIQGVSVSATAPVLSQFLQFDGTAWSPNYISASQIKNNLGLAQFPNNCTASQTLVYSVLLAQYVCTDIAVPGSSITGLGTSAVKDVASIGNANSSQVVMGNDSRLSDSRAPSGSAGGDLAGTYPSPSLTTTGVTAGTYPKVQVDSKGRVLAGGGLTAADIPTLDYSKIATGKPTTLAGYGITDAVPSNGSVSSLSSGLDSARPAAGTAGKVYFSTDTQKIYIDTGVSWILMAAGAAGSGTVTGVTAGTGLTGGTINTSGTIAVDVGTTANKIVQLDSSGKLPALDASALTGISAPFSNFEILDSTSATTWSVPANVKKVFVEVWGAGAGGSGTGNGGGAGGYASWFTNVTPGGSVTYKVGAGGVGGVWNAAGTAGEASIFNSISVNGGSLGQITTPGAGGVVTTTSTVNGISGSSGTSASVQTVTFLLSFVSYMGGDGGSAPRGGQGGLGNTSNSNPGGNGVAPGGAGGGGFGNAGGNGAKGRIIVWW